MRGAQGETDGMALWQFSFSPIPAAKANIGGVDVIYLGPEALDGIDLDLSPNDLEPLFSAFDALLPEKRSWSDSLRIWGDEKAHDIQVSFDGTRVECIEFRLDVSKPSVALVNGICALARQFGWVLVSRTGAVIQPTPEAVARVIIQSPASKYVSDPQAYLAQATRPDGGRT
jgi:hypothetical protein